MPSYRPQTMISSRRRPGLRAASAVLALGLVAPLAACADSSTAASDRSATASPAATGTSASLTLGTKATYSPFAPASGYEAAPAGFEPVLVEHVGRHGSRLLSSKSTTTSSPSCWSSRTSQTASPTSARSWAPTSQRSPQSTRTSATGR